VSGVLQQDGDIQGGNMNKKVCVANLPFQTGEAELKALFSKAGSVMSVKIVKDRQTGQPRGIAFVEMSTQWEGRRAVSMLNRQDSMGKNLVVKEPTEKRSFRGR
jgi:cold-inducible RNA-binding protein